MNVGAHAHEGIIQMLIVNAARNQRKFGDRLGLVTPGLRRPMTWKSWESMALISLAGSL